MNSVSHMTFCHRFTIFFWRISYLVNNYPYDFFSIVFHIFLKIGYFGNHCPYCFFIIDMAFNLFGKINYLSDFIVNEIIHVMFCILFYFFFMICYFGINCGNPIACMALFHYFNYFWKIRNFRFCVNFIAYLFLWIFPILYLFYLNSAYTWLSYEMRDKPNSCVVCLFVVDVLSCWRVVQLEIREFVCLFVVSCRGLPFYELMLFFSSFSFSLCCFSLQVRKCGCVFMLMIIFVRIIFNLFPFID